MTTRDQQQLALLADAIGELYETLGWFSKGYDEGFVLRVNDRLSVFRARLAALRSSAPREGAEAATGGWETIDAVTGRTEVPGGWIYAIVHDEPFSDGTSMRCTDHLFVPSGEPEWRALAERDEDLHRRIAKLEESYGRWLDSTFQNSPPSASDDPQVDEPERACDHLKATERYSCAKRRGHSGEHDYTRPEPGPQPDRYTAEEIAAAMRTTFGYSSKMLLDRLAETRPLPEPSRMVRVYLSARFGRAEEVFQRGQELIQLGYDVASRWYHADADESKLTPADWARIAADDIADIERADVLVAFTEEPIGSGYVAASEVNGALRGGRQAELGYALARKLRVVVIGPRENAFHHLPGVEQFDSWDAYAATIGRAEVRS
jgi:hypothetical protein